MNEIKGWKFDRNGVEHEIREETFSVWQFLIDDISECVRRRVALEEALKAAEHYTQNVAAVAGITRRVIIVDAGDSIVFEWKFGEGVTFPDNVVEPQKRDYGK